MPTHAETAAADEAPAAEPPAAGPRTAVIPRGKTAKGKPQRQQSFATNVDIKDVLERATPLFPIAAISDEEATAATRDATSVAPEPATADATSSTSPTSRDSAERVSPPTREPAPDVTAKLARPPSRGLLVLVALGGLALAAGAVYMFFANRDRVLGAGDRDAAVPALADAMPAVAGDASVAADAAGLAAPALDAGIADAPPAPRDAGTRRSDAARASGEPKPDARVRGTATLEVGAIPWGEIYVDGKLVGRTPRVLTVPAGRHTVEIVFPAETPPRKQTFAVELEPGETKPLHADFGP